MSASTTLRDLPTARSREQARDAVADPDRIHESADLDGLAHLMAAPITGAAHRGRFDRALALLAGPEGAAAAHLLPDAHTPDVVRHRIAGWVLSRLSPHDPRHRHLAADALAILRP